MTNNEDFLYIEDCKNDIDRIIKDIINKCENLSSIYKEYIKEAAKKEEFLSSLDKMLFQIEITKEDVNKAYLKIQKKIHPDVSPETSRLSSIVNEARDILLNEIK